MAAARIPPSIASERSAPSRGLIGNLVLSLTRIAIFVLLALRLVQIWINPVDDFDTSSFILAVQGGFYPDFGIFFDLAHPGLLSVWLWLGHLLKLASNSPPIQLWAAFIGAALVLACLMLYGCLRSARCSVQVSALGVLLYLASPAIADVAARSEENVLFHGLFFIAILAVLRALRATNGLALARVCASALLLAAQHLQPFLILSAGLMLFCVVGRFAPDADCAAGRARAFSVLLAFLVPGLLYYAAAHATHINPSVVSSYSDHVYSLFQNDSLARYLRAFLMFAQGYVASGDLTVTQWTTRAVEPASLIYLAGLIVLAAAIWLSLRRGLVDLMVLPALGFVFLYEPSASERWDTFAIAVVVSLMFRLRDWMDRSNRPAFIGVLACCLLLLAFNLLAVRGQVDGLRRASAVQQAFGTQMGGSDVVRTDLDSGRVVVSRVPRDTRFLVPGAEPLRAGDVVYLSSGIAAVEQRFGIRCAATDIAGLCRALP